MSSIMFYRQSRSSARDVSSDDEVDWPHVKTHPRAESGEPAQPNKRRQGARSIEPLDEQYMRDAMQVVAEMHSSSSDRSSSSSSSLISTSTSALSIPNSASSSSSAYFTEEGVDTTQRSRHASGDDSLAPERSEPHPLLVHSVEQVLAFLLLRGRTTVSQTAYDILRRFYNATLSMRTGSASRAARLPLLETVRQTIGPRIRQAWGFAIRTVQLRTSASSVSVAVGLLHLSDHMRRDFAFIDFSNLFFLAGRRGKKERRWHPEFCDSPFCSVRAELLKTGATLNAFEEEGILLRRGDIVTISLAGRAALCNVTVVPRAFAGRGAEV